MRIAFCIFLIITGLVPLIYLSYKEKDPKVHWKIMIAASCGACLMTGILLIILVKAYNY